MKKKIFSPLFLTMIATVLIGCSSNTSGDVQEKVTLKFGHNAPAKSPTGEAAEKLSKLVEEKTNGDFTIEVYPENQLGDNRELVEQISIGGLDMSMAGLGVLGYLAPEYNFMQIPFLFESQEHVHKVINGEIGQEIAEKLKEDKDILLLSQTWDRLPRQVSANKSITSPEDFKELMIRTGTIAATETFSLLGAKPTSVPLNEVYLSLQNNIIESVELPADYMVNLSVAEVNSHINLTNHSYGTQFVAINNKKFNELSQEYQDILLEAVDEAGIYNNELTAEAEGDFISQLEEQGMEIIELSEEERRSFESFVQEHIDELESNWEGTEGLGKRILNNK